MLKRTRWWNGWGGLACLSLVLLGPSWAHAVEPSTDHDVVIVGAGAAGLYAAYVLDGDNVRFGLNRDLGFSPEDRTENIRRIGEVCRLFQDAGLVVLTAFISPYQTDRDQVRALHGPGQFVEVFVDTPIEVCEARDTKGLYAKARAGEIAEFSGFSAPYEPPENPELVVDTTEPLAVCVARVLEALTLPAASSKPER